MHINKSIFSSFNFAWTLIMCLLSTFIEHCYYWITKDQDNDHASNKTGIK